MLLSSNTVIFFFFKDKGKVYVWGLGQGGRLGLGDEKEQPKPKVVKALQSSEIRFIACGVAHSIAVSHSNTIYSW